MSYISLAIYGAAAIWAVQTLLLLMTQHRRRTLARLKRAELARREAEVKELEDVASRLPGKVVPATQLEKVGSR